VTYNFTHLRSLAPFGTKRGYKRITLPYHHPFEDSSCTHVAQGAKVLGSKMTEPLPLETILEEFTEDANAWVLRDAESGKYVIIPHPNYPGRHIIHFFLNPTQAEKVRKKIRKASPALKNRNIAVEEVKLLHACRNIAADKTPEHADSFVVHPYNEVWEFLNET
jgi:hypothetical protein